MAVSVLPLRSRPGRRAGRVCTCLQREGGCDHQRGPSGRAHRRPGLARCPQARSLEGLSPRPALQPSTPAPHHAPPARPSRGARGRWAGPCVLRTGHSAGELVGAVMARSHSGHRACAGASARKTPLCSYFPGVATSTRDARTKQPALLAVPDLTPMWGKFHSRGV